ncbi:hypothetical protein ACFL0M_03285 [Thermodesulfobacteriota bacterium]
MRIKQHMFAGALVSGGVGWYITPKAGVLVMIGSALLDIDHYLWYALRFGDWSFRRAKDFFEAKKANDYYCLCVLHTLEAIVLYLALVWLGGPVFWFSVGCLTHMVLDVAQSVWDRGLFLRKWSIIHAIFYWANHRFMD